MRHGSEGNHPTIPMPDEKKIEAFHIIRDYFLHVIEYRGSFDRYGLFSSEPKISSYGAKLIENAAMFMDSEVDTAYLERAYESISKDIPELYNYSPGPEIMGQKSDIDFDFSFGFGFLTGGAGHGQGTINEKTPSGYAAFTLTKDDKNDYTDLLVDCLDRSYPLLREGFKAHNDNEGFRTALKAFISSESADMRTTKVMNDYIMNVGREAQSACKIREVLEKYGAEKIYKDNLDLQSLKGKMRNSGFRVMYDTTEFFSRHPMVWGMGGLLGISALGVGAVGQLSPGAAAVVFFGGGPLVVAGCIAMSSDHQTMYEDACALLDLEKTGYRKR